MKKDNRLKKANNLVKIGNTGNMHQTVETVLSPEHRTIEYSSCLAT